MTRSRLVLLVVLSAALSAAVTSWLTRTWCPGPLAEEPSDPPPHHDQDFHQWLHAHLELTPEQQEALAPAEQRFEAERARLLGELEKISADLAHTLSDPAQGPDELKPLMEKRHHLQGLIQQLVITHLLEKREQLTPAQQEHYREWVHKSISHDHGD